jgi:hypothetical protein
MKESYREKLYKFVVPRFDISMLAVKALDAYNYLNSESLTFDKIEEMQLNHIMVNYIRHKLVSDYNQNYSSPSFSKEPKLYFEWFKAINHEIGQVYPFLRQAIAMQIAHKRNVIFHPRKKEVTK